MAIELPTFLSFIHVDNEDVKRHSLSDITYYPI